MHFPEIDLAGFDGRMREQIETVDGACRSMAALRLCNGPSIDELRERADGYERSGLTWLAGRNRDEANLLEVDARLWAMRGLCVADANRVDGGRFAFFTALGHYEQLVLEANGLPQTQPCLELHRRSRAAEMASTRVLREARAA